MHHLTCALILISPLTSFASQANSSWTLATADTRVAIAVVNDRPVVQTLQCPKCAHNWAGDGLRVPLMDRVAVGGSEVKTTWQFERGDFDERARTLTLTFANAKPRLVLRSIWRARPGAGPVEHWIEIENLARERVMITHQDSLSLDRMAMPAGLSVTAHSVRRGGSNASAEGGFYADSVNADLHKELVGSPADGRSFVPWLALQAGDKHGLYVGWEFSGIGRVQVDGAEGSVDVKVGNMPDFQTDVEPGEAFLVPAAFVGCYSGDLDEGSYRLHRFIIEKLLPPYPKKHVYPTISYNPYLDASAERSTEETLLRCTRMGHELGFEILVADALWFPASGDWRWDPARYPQGGAPIADYCHQNGMEFGLWCAWHMAGTSKDPGALNVFEHPDWLQRMPPPDFKVTSLFAVIEADTGHAPARDWIIDKASEVVTRDKVDFFKHDGQAIITTCEAKNHKHHYDVDVSYWAATGYYEIMDALRQRFPNTVLENCNGGGLIKDFGALKRAHYICSTDTLQSLVDRHSAWDTTWVIPPVTMMLYTYENGAPLPSDRPGPFLWRSAMMGSWVCAPTNTAAWGDSEKQSVKRAVEVYKSWIRPILRDCKVLHILPRPTDKQWDGLFYWSQSLKHGIAFIFRPDAPADRQAIRLKGLDRKRKYWVWCEDGSAAPGLLTGAELMDTGLSMSLQERYTSDLVYVQDAALGKPDGLEPPGEFALKSAKLDTTTFCGLASLEWAPSEDATGYRVLVSEDPHFKKLLTQSVVSEPRKTIGRLRFDREFYWKVEAFGWGGSRWNSGGAAEFATPAREALPGVTFVSDIEWISATSGSDVVHRDENYGGQLLSLHGKQYPKGVWTHAFSDTTPADLSLDTSGKGFGLFIADVGIEIASQGGTVVFQVLADGRAQAESPLMRKGEVHRLSANVAGAREVILRVTNGGDGNGCDHAAWGLARFVSEGSEDPLQ